jgi:hypothetical protein
VAKFAWLLVPLVFYGIAGEDAPSAELAARDMRQAEEQMMTRIATADPEIERRVAQWLTAHHDGLLFLHEPADELTLPWTGLRSFKKRFGRSRRATSTFGLLAEICFYEFWPGCDLVGPGSDALLQDGPHHETVASDMALAALLRAIRDRLVGRVRVIYEDI